MEKMIADPAFLETTAEKGVGGQNFDLAGIVDIDAIQSLMDEFFRLTNIGVAIMDMAGNVLVATGWQDICVKFHRVHPQTLKNCRESDLKLSNGVAPGTFRLYRCKNNMWDIATPILVGGRKVGNLYLGQFLFEDEALDIETFRLQARTYGFDEDAYIAALRRTPRWRRETVDTAMRFYTKLASLISETGYANVLLKRALEEKNGLLDSLSRSEASYREIVENLNDVLYSVSPDGAILYVSPPIQSVLGYSPDELMGRNFFQLIHPDDLEDIQKAFGDVLQGLYTPDEYRMLTKAGDYRWVRTSSRSVSDARGGAVIQGVLADVHQRKKAEHALIENERRLKESQKTARIGHVEYDVVSGEIVWADIVYELFERDPKSGPPSYEEVMALHHPEDAVQLERRIRAAIENATPYSIDLQVSLPSGKKMFYHAIGRPLTNDAGSVTNIIGTVQDVTKRKRAEESVRISEEKFSKAFHSAPVLMTISEVDTGRYLDVNDAFARVTGYGRETAIGKRSVELGLISPRNRRRLSHLLHHHGRVQDWELNLTRADGSDLICLYGAEIIEVGHKKRLFSIASDITDRKRVEHQLRESRERFEKVFNSHVDAIFVLNAESPPAVIESNTAASKIFGYEMDEMVGDATDKLHVGASHLETFGRELRAAIQQEGHLHHFEFSMKRKDGTIFPTEHTVLELKNDAGKRTGRVSIVRDLTERNAMAARLQQAQKMEAIGTLAGGIAHDFNNILFPVLGYAEMLQDEILKDSRLKSHVDGILIGTLRARDLVKQILAFSRQGEQEMKPIRLQPIVKEVLKLLRATIPTNIAFHSDIDPVCGPVMADPTQIHQITMNLATNAYHAMEEEGGQMSIRLEKAPMEQDPFPFKNQATGDCALLTVTDTGIGIEKDILDKVFDPYFTTKEKYKGTGLGLSVVQGIVENCGGVVQIFSQPGRGTEVRVCLPLIKQSQSPVSQPADEARPIQGGNERILLVDDEAIIVRMIQQLLERLGYRVTPRTGSVEALEAFRAHPDKFDLVFTDMTMPNMTGDKLAMAIKKIRPEIPIILCTGFSNQIDDEKCKEMGIQGYVMKPVVKKDMDEIIRKVLDAPKGRPADA